jgi:p-aminobenzoyl-glutamate transporter AbgT
MTRAVVYFALVFGVGFLLGTVRVLLLEPYLGERWSELAEMPLMLVAIILAARLIVRRFPARHRRSYLVAGGAALIFLVLVEFSVVIGIRGLSIAQYVAKRDPIAGGVYVLMLVVFAVMPWVVGSTRAAAKLPRSLHG